MMAKEKVEPFHPEYGLKPSVCYLGMPKRFIAGEVVLSDRMNECGAGIPVTLTGGNESFTQQTDVFGDFEFEGLSSEIEYTLKVEHGGYVSKVMNIRPNRDVNVGIIALDRD